MAEKTSNTRKPLEGKVTDETRQHYRTARDEFRKSIEGFFPPEFREHHRKARKEMLLAWRSMIDTTIEHLDKK
jgi:hypothetical protein